MVEFSGIVITPRKIRLLKFECDKTRKDVLSLRVANESRQPSGWSSRIVCVQNEAAGTGATV